MTSLLKIGNPQGIMLSKSIIEYLKNKALELTGLLVKPISKKDTSLFGLWGNISDDVDVMVRDMRKGRKFFRVFK